MTFLKKEQQYKGVLQGAVVGPYRDVYKKDADHEWIALVERLHTELEHRDQLPIDTFPEDKTDVRASVGTYPH